MEKTILAIVMLLLLATTARGSEQTHDSDEQLQEVVVWSGKRKLKSLSSRGTRIPGAVSVFTPDKVGYEVSTALDVKHPFEVERITLDIVSNNIEGATLNLQIYRDSTFAPLLSRPILIAVPQGKRQTLTAVPTERILLEPGSYSVGITFADCSEAIKQQWSENSQWDATTRYEMQRHSLQFPLYLKEGYIRGTTDDTPEKNKANIGLRVMGRVCE